MSAGWKSASWSARPKANSAMRQLTGEPLGGSAADLPAADRAEQA